MKRLLGLLACAAAILGTLALATSAPVSASSGHVCKVERRCLYEEGATCPPCYELAPCGPHCGCKAIPGCRL